MTQEAFLTGDYSDFTSFSLYLSDILLFLGFILFALPRGRELYHVVYPVPKPDIANKDEKKSKNSSKNKLFYHLQSFWFGVGKFKWLILLIFISFIVNFGLNTRLHAFFLIKWLELIVAYGTFVMIFRETTLKSLFIRLFTWLSTLQSIIALVQFFNQGSLGIYKLGEKHLSPNLLGVAKIVSGGTKFIRTYGTFPHPNPFSAFLLAGVFFAIYLAMTSTRLKVRIFYWILIFIQVLGLTTTFSRGAIIVLVVGLIILFGSLFYVILGRADGNATPSSKKIASAALAMTIISMLISFFLFKPFLLTRGTFSDQSTIDRRFYNSTGIKMAEKNPIFGLGMGESLLHMEQYLPTTNFHTDKNNLQEPKPSKNNGSDDESDEKFEAGEQKTLKPWDKQPPHNYFIIAAAELGLLAMLVLLWIFISHLWALLKRLKAEMDFKLISYPLSLITIFVCFLLLMQFDHYFYTLNQTQLLLWIFLALVSSETKNPQTGD